MHDLPSPTRLRLIVAAIAVLAIVSGLAFVGGRTNHAAAVGTSVSIRVSYRLSPSQANQFQDETPPRIELVNGVLQSSNGVKRKLTDEELGDLVQQSSDAGLFRANVTYGSFYITDTPETVITVTNGTHQYQHFIAAMGFEGDIVASPKTGLTTTQLADRKRVANLVKGMQGMVAKP
jgi:hypothetical protein